MIACGHPAHIDPTTPAAEIRAATAEALHAAGWTVAAGDPDATRALRCPAHQGEVRGVRALEAALRRMG